MVPLIRGCHNPLVAPGQLDNGAHCAAAGDLLADGVACQIGSGKAVRDTPREIPGRINFVPLPALTVIAKPPPIGHMAQLAVKAIREEIRKVDFRPWHTAAIWQEFLQQPRFRPPSPLYSFCPLYVWIECTGRAVVADQHQVAERRALRELAFPVGPRVSERGFPASRVLTLPARISPNVQITTQLGCCGVGEPEVAHQRARKLVAAGMVLFPGLDISEVKPRPLDIFLAGILAGLGKIGRRAVIGARVERFHNRLRQRYRQAPVAQDVSLTINRATRPEHIAVEIAYVSIDGELAVAKRLGFTVGSDRRTVIAMLAPTWRRDCPGWWQRVEHGLADTVGLVEV